MTQVNARNFMRRGLALVPVDHAALEWVEALPFGREVLVTIQRPRSPEHHRWYFAMLYKVVKATGSWGSEGELLDALKLELGHSETRCNMYGSPYQAPKSISFAKMGQDEFRSFAERSMEVIALATGIDPEELMREVVAEQGPLVGSEER
jgi:hypothetical protein